jgi:two-component system, cell cycle response regulator DivK
MDRRRPRNIPSRPLVLVADDHERTRDMYLASLGAFGFEAVAVPRCADTFREAWERHPDAVVADLPLLDAEEWQLIQNLKRNVRTRAIPIVLLSGHAAPSVRERALREGCAAYFVKPCLPEQLARALRLAVDRSSAACPPADREYTHR